VPDSYAWLSSWDKRVELTTDHTVVDAALSNYPAYVKLSTSSGKTSTDVSCIFDEVGSNWQKIAVANSSDVQCYVEKVSWDDTGETAELWVKLVSVSNSADENWYLYYDNDHADNTAYVKDVGDATDVWDSDFKMVQHMLDLTTSTTEDSTSNNNDGTKKGANEPNEATGQIGKGQDFDGENDYVSEDLQIGNNAAFTITFWAKTTSGSNVRPYSEGYTSDKEHYVMFSMNESVAGDIEFQMKDDAANGSYTPTGDIGLNDGNWHFISGVQQNKSYREIFTDCILRNSDTTELGTITLDETGIGVGRRGTVFQDYFNGTTDEVRISFTARSVEWRKADYYSGNDTLFTFGSEEGWAVLPTLYYYLNN